MVPKRPNERGGAKTPPLLFGVDPPNTDGAPRGIRTPDTWFRRREVGWTRSHCPTPDLTIFPVNRPNSHHDCPSGVTQPSQFGGVFSSLCWQNVVEDSSPGQRLPEQAALPKYHLRIGAAPRGYLWPAAWVWPYRNGYSSTSFGGTPASCSVSSISSFSASGS